MVARESLLDTFREEVRRLTGVHLPKEKNEMLAGRLRRRVRASGAEDLKAYLAIIRSGDRKELPLFVDAVTTHKTSFFRTRDVWRYVWEEDLPARFARGGRILAWSAACSTGQETASLSMLLAAGAERHGSGSFLVEASDVSGPAVQQAKAMTFAARDVARAASTHAHFDVEKRFAIEGDEAVLVPELRSRQRFSVHNLFDRPRHRQVDLLFVRNVLIYFTPEDKLKVVRTLLPAVRPGGLLVIGESESLIGMGDLGLTKEAHCVFRKGER